MAGEAVQLAGELPSVAVIVMTPLRSGLADSGVGQPAQAAADQSPQQVEFVVLLGIAALIGTEHLLGTFPHCFRDNGGHRANDDFALAVVTAFAK